MSEVMNVGVMNVGQSFWQPWNLPRYHFISPATMLDGRHCSEWALNVDLAHCVRGTPWYTVSVGHTGRLCQGDTLGHFVRETHWH